MASDGGKPVHKWPIRPGVHVHVNGLHPLNKSGARSPVGSDDCGGSGPPPSSSSSSKAASLNRSVNRGTSTDNSQVGSKKSKTKGSVELRNKGELCSDLTYLVLILQEMAFTNCSYSFIVNLCQFFASCIFKKSIWYQVLHKKLPVGEKMMIMIMSHFLCNSKSVPYTFA